MQRFGSWLFVLIIAGGVAFTYFKYIRGETSDVGASVQENEIVEAPAPKPDPVIIPEPPPVREPEPVVQPPTTSRLFQQAIELMRTEPERGAEAFQLLIRLDENSEEAVQAAAILGVYYFDQKEAAKAKEYLSVALKGQIAAEQRADLQRRLNLLEADLNTSLARFVELYEVQPGDVLARIGAAHGIPFQLIMRLNNMQNDTIRVGQRLRVVQGPFHVMVEKSKFTLSVYLGDNFVKSYPVGIGMHDSTPEGEWVVESKLAEPVWYRPGRAIPYGDPDNALGTRWIGFMPGYGIHGTWEPDTIGKNLSEGCVRMFNKDVEELFDLLVSRRSKVTIRP